MCKVVQNELKSVDKISTLNSVRDMARIVSLVANPVGQQSVLRMEVGNVGE